MTADETQQRVAAVVDRAQRAGERVVHAPRGFDVSTPDEATALDEALTTLVNPSTPPSLRLGAASVARREVDALRAELEQAHTREAAVRPVLDAAQAVTSINDNPYVCAPPPRHAEAIDALRAALTTYRAAVASPDAGQPAGQLHPDDAVEQAVANARLAGVTIDSPEWRTVLLLVARDAVSADEAVAAYREVLAEAVGQPAGDTTQPAEGAAFAEMATVIDEVIAHYHEYNELDEPWLAETARRLRALAEAGAPARPDGQPPAWWTPRLLTCIEQWPDCSEGGYDPRCCRFPKSCSCTVYDEDRVAADALETWPLAGAADTEEPTDA